VNNIDLCTSCILNETEVEDVCFASPSNTVSYPSSKDARISNPARGVYSALHGFWLVEYSNVRPGVSH